MLDVIIADLSTRENRYREEISVVRDEAVIWPDGSLGWHEWTHRAFFDAQAGIVELQSVGRDITEREWTEEALRTSEKRYRAVFELAADGIVMLREGRAIDCNQRLLKLLGRTSEEVLGKTPWDL